MRMRQRPDLPPLGGIPGRRDWIYRFERLRHEKRARRQLIAPSPMPYGGRLGARVASQRCPILQGGHGMIKHLPRHKEKSARGRARSGPESLSWIATGVARGLQAQAEPVEDSNRIHLCP